MKLPPARIVFLVVLAGAAAAFIVTGAWLRSLATRAPERLPVLGAVPAFSLASSSGAELSLENLRGFVWVADVIDPSDSGSFARSLRMADFQAAFERAKSVRLVTFVTGPAAGSAAEVSKLALSFGAKPDRWIFAAGSPVPAFAGFLVVDRDGIIREKVPESRPSASSDVLDAVGDLLRQSSGSGR